MLNLHLKKNICSDVFRRLKTYVCDREASSLPFIALSLPVILGMVGLATDASLWMAQKRELQAAADAAAIAAAWEVAQNTDEYMDYASLKEATNNGYDSSANGDLETFIADEVADGFVVQVNLSQDVRTFFSRILSSEPVRVNVDADALASTEAGNFCILALEEFGSDSLATFGSVVVDSPDCGVAANSISEESLTMAGNVEMTVDNIRLSGDYTVGGSVDLSYNSLKTHRPPTPDPYEDLEVPAYGACDHNRTRVNSNATLSPGVYCGGLTITGNNRVEFEPGVYILDGDTFDVSGGGELIGEGVTFILTGNGNDYAQMDISGNRYVQFSAPLAGEEWGGITFFQDRNAPSDARKENRIIGTSDVVFDGVAYFPSQGLRFGGNATMVGADNPCTKLIARTVILAGNPRLGNSCDDFDPEAIQVPDVKLIR